jgi:2-C-methyl-D-erythritol 4-phosphate cytidylyltransferase
MKNIVAILAGGSGSRFGADRPKQFIEYKGKLVIEHCIEKFQFHNRVDEIIIACSNEWKDFVLDIVNKNNYSKVSKFVKSGDERYESSLNVLNSIEESNDNILIHDAARAFISEAIITRVIEALNTYKCVGVGIESSDTIMELDNDGFIKSVPNRNRLRRAQTPQAFKLNVIKKAYNEALKSEHIIATDDCGIVINYLPYEKIYVVQGDEENIKITFQEDLK